MKDLYIKCSALSLVIKQTFWEVSAFSWVTCFWLTCWFCLLFSNLEMWPSIMSHFNSPVLKNYLPSQPQLSLSEKLYTTGTLIRYGAGWLCGKPRSRRVWRHARALPVTDCEILAMSFYLCQVWFLPWQNEDENLCPTYLTGLLWGRN